MNKINSAKELRDYFNKEYGITKKWPRTFYVNSETYADCCQEVFNWFLDRKDYYRLGSNENGQYYMIHLPLGTEKGGLKFKGVELILDKVM